MQTHLLPRMLWMYLLVHLFIASASAQNARFSGQVTDTQGSAIPNASVEVLNLDTMAKRSAATDDSGMYSVPYLPAGRYQVIVKAPDFNTSINDGVRLGVGDTFVLNLQLTVGATASEVKVVGGGATEINTQSPEVSGTVTTQEVLKLALNGRNFTQLITLTPGVSNQSQQDEALVGPIGQAKYSFNGGRTEYNSFEVDGSDVLNLSIYPTAVPLIVTPSLDAIQEIKVMTSNYGAMYGRTASGVVEVSTKSGTSQFHGNGYEFLRNEVFNSRNYFDPGSHAPLYRRNDFGFTLGGPLYIPNAYNTGKDKTFFFFSEEFRRDQTPVSYRVGAPTAKEFKGNFEDLCPSGARGVPNDTYQMTTSDLLTYSGCPLSGTSAQPYLGAPQATYGADPVPGAMEPNMAAILASGVIPVANTSKGGCNSNTGNCYNATLSPLTTWREELFRIDHDVTSRHRLLLRYIHDAWDTTVLSPQWGFMQSQNTYPTVQNRFTGPGINVVAGLSSTLTTSLLNSFTISYTDSRITLAEVGAPGVDLTRPKQLDSPACANGSSQTDCPMGYIFDNGFGNKMPGFAVVGSSAGFGGGNLVMDTGYMPWEHTSPTYNLTDNLTKLIGKHSFQGGTQVMLLERNQMNSAVGAASGDVQGFLTFRQSGTSDTLYNLLSANGMQSYQQDSGQGRFHQRSWVAEPYLQDDWRLTNRLTMNLGLRMSIFGNFYERGRDLYNWEPSKFNRAIADTLAVDSYFGFLFTKSTGAAIPRSTGVLDPRISNGLVHCGYGGVPASCMSSSLWNPAPRVGFAWDITGQGRLALRGGYGIFYEHGTPYEANTGSLEANPPAVTSVTQYLSSTSSMMCIGGGVPGEVCGGQGQAAYPISLTSVPTKTHWSYAQQWNLSFQQQLPRDIVVTAGYVGSRGTHLIAELQLNQLQPVPNALNPYSAHVPFQAGDCAGLSGPDPLHPIPAGSQASFNLSVACGEQGITGGLNALAAVRVTAPGLDKIISIQPIASSSYHAFQLLARRTKASLTMDMAYTYSHSIDDSSDRTELPVNGLDINQNKASSSFDQRHLFEVSYVYQLHLDKVWWNILNWAPKDPNNDWKPRYAVAPMSHVAHVLLDNWELSGLTLIQTGAPFSVYNSGYSTSSTTSISTADNAGVANGLSPLYSSYPDLIRSAKRGVHAAQVAGGNNASSFGPLLLNPGAFAAPRGLTFGNAGRNALNNPRRTNFDISLLKHFSIFREDDMEFRVESFNTFNHTQFRIFDPTLGNQSGNTVSCYGPQASQYSAGFAGDSTNAGCLTGSGFLHPVDAHRPRTMQFGLKLAF